MKFARVRIEGTYEWAWIDGSMWRAAGSFPPRRPSDHGAWVQLRDGDLVAPVDPSKVLCVGRNYRAHAKEMGNDVPTEPLLFLKPPSAIIGPGDAIVLPSQSVRVEHEGELAVILGQDLRNATREQARDAIFGYTCANDVTARDLQKRDVQFTRAKGFDTFCPLGPWIVTERPADDAEIVVTVNGTERQRGHLREMVFGIDELLVSMSSVMTLLAGDVILTGTPQGVGPLAAGDVVTVKIDGIGELTNPVRSDERGKS